MLFKDKEMEGGKSLGVCVKASVQAFHFAYVQEVYRLLLNVIAYLKLIDLLLLFPLIYLNIMVYILVYNAFVSVILYPNTNTTTSIKLPSPLFLVPRFLPTLKSASWQTNNNLLCLYTARW